MPFRRCVPSVGSSAARGSLGGAMIHRAGPVVEHGRVLGLSWFVLSERVTPYEALLTGCITRRARLTLLGVTARFTARPGWTARRTLRGTNKRVRNPMAQMDFGLDAN
jgi:hypothetical protein